MFGRLRPSWTVTGWWSKREVVISCIITGGAVAVSAINGALVSAVRLPSLWNLSPWKQNTQPSQTPLVKKYILRMLSTNHSRSEPHQLQPRLSAAACKHWRKSPGTCSYYFWWHHNYGRILIWKLWWLVWCTWPLTKLIFPTKDIPDFVSVGSWRL